VACSWLPVDRETAPPATSIALSLDVAPLMTCFLGAINDVEKAFWGRVFFFPVLGDRSWEYGLIFQWKHQFVVEIFRWIDQTVNLAPQMKEGDLNWRWNFRFQHSKKNRDRRFLRENLIWKKLWGEEREFTILWEIIVNLVEHCGVDDYFDLCPPLFSWISRCMSTL